jgi:hypothetical protein
MSSRARILVISVALVCRGLLGASMAGAQTDAADRPDSDVRKPVTTVTTRAEVGPDGYDISFEIVSKAPGKEAGPRGSEGKSAEAGTSRTVAPVPPAAAEGSAPGQALTGPPGTATTDGGEDPASPLLTVQPMRIIIWAPDGPVQVPRLSSPGAFVVYENGTLRDVLVMVPHLPPDVRPPGGGGVDPREVALDILSHISLPHLKVRMSPAVGLVARPSWYWVEGYRGETFGESRTVSIPPAVGPEVPSTVVPVDDPRRQGSSFTVEVRVWGSRYDWSFGDGKMLSGGSLGRPYPAESDVQHSYGHSSLPFPGGFPVRLTAEFSAEYRVDGGGPQGLPSVRRTYEAGFRVQEIQTVLVGGR